MANNRKRTRGRKISYQFKPPVEKKATKDIKIFSLNTKRVDENRLGLEHLVGDSRKHLKPKMKIGFKKLIRNITKNEIIVIRPNKTIKHKSI